MTFRLQPIARITGSLGLALALSLGGSAAFADDDDATAFLYEGTCADLEAATVVTDIDDLDSEDDDDNDVWDLIGNGEDRPDDLLESEADLDDFDDVQALVDGDFAVAVHETENRSSDVIACGDIEGDVEDNSVLISLDEVDGSGWEGRTFIHPNDDDDDDDDDNDSEIEFAVGIYPVGSVEPLDESTPTG